MVMLALRDLTRPEQGIELARELALQGSREVLLVGLTRQLGLLETLATLHRLAAPLRAAGLKVILRSEGREMDAAIASAITGRPLTWLVDSDGHEARVQAAPPRASDAPGV